MKRPGFWKAVMLCLLGWTSPMPAQGFQNEIQVFTQDLQAPGEWGMDLHLNTILQGPDRVASDEVPFIHAVNTVAELSVGLAPSFEAGLYLPVSWRAGGHDLFAGPEARLKWLPIRPEGDGSERGAFLGANVSVAWPNQVFSSAHAHAGVTGIVGFQGEHWLFAANPSLTWTISGADAGTSPEVGSSWKVAWLGLPEIHPGMELYADHGPSDRLQRMGDQQQNLYATLDVDHRPWVFNVGLGRGLTPVSDRWTLKFVFEVPFR